MWLLGLALLPRTGLGPSASLLLATPPAVAAAVGLERLRSPSARAPRGAPRRRAPMGAGRAVALTLGAVALLAYVVFVLRSA